MATYVTIKFMVSIFHCMHTLTHRLHKTDPMATAGKQLILAWKITRAAINLHMIFFELVSNFLSSMFHIYLVPFLPSKYFCSHHSACVRVHMLYSCVYAFVCETYDSWFLPKYFTIRTFVKITHNTYILSLSSSHTRHGQNHKERKRKVKSN